jgi:hypothetical protein
MMNRIVGLTHGFVVLLLLFALMARGLGLLAGVMAGCLSMAHGWLWRGPNRRSRIVLP